MNTRLSILVVAHNEEAQLEDCLSKLEFADELVVVLDKCTDGSKSIARRHGAKVLEGAWDIEGDRRNTGIAACGGEWILEVDADERVSPELATEIGKAIQQQTYGYFLIPFDNYVGTRRVRYGWGCYWGVSAAPRLFAKGCKSWGGQRVHPAVHLTGPEGRLTNRMIHYVDRDISDMLQRLDRYTTARARDIRESPEKGAGYGRNIRRIFSRFFKCYVRRKGYREGKHGFLVALMAGLYPILSYLKAELEEDEF